MVLFGLWFREQCEHMLRSISTRVSSLHPDHTLEIRALIEIGQCLHRHTTLLLYVRTHVLHAYVGLHMNANTKAADNGLVPELSLLHIYLT